LRCWDTAGWGDAELALDHLGHLPGRRFAVGEQLEDAPAHRVAQHVEGVHRRRAHPPV
jgi:hypothetical protein